MRIFKKYNNEIKERKNLGLETKPIDYGELLKEIISNILESKSKYH